MDTTTLLQQLDALTVETLNEVPLENLTPQLGSSGLGFDPEHQCVAGSEHYRLLYELSGWFNNSTIVDIGTGQGGSALCLSVNTTNNVITYDVSDRFAVVKPSNVETVIGNYLSDPRLLSASLIFFDLGDHDGVLEQQLYDFLVTNNYKGMTVWDDINWTDGMKSFWESVTKPKRDITHIGHGSGTGVIVFE